MKTFRRIDSTTGNDMELPARARTSPSDFGHVALPLHTPWSLRVAMAVTRSPRPRCQKPARREYRIGKVLGAEVAGGGFISGSVRIQDGDGDCGFT